MIVANEPYTDQLHLQKSTWLLFTSIYFDTTVSPWRGSIDQTYAKTNEIWRQNSEIHPAFACSRRPPWFPDLSRPYGACVKRGSGNICSVSVFFARVGSQIYGSPTSMFSNISSSGEERFKYPLPWENKISQMPDPTLPQGQQRQSNPHPMP